MKDIADNSQAALRTDEIEFVLVRHPWLENDTYFADIILPTTTKFEEKDIMTTSMCGANNLICPNATTSKNAPGEVTNGFLVNIEKVDVLETREDGLVVIDPEKARGRKDLAERFDGVYWNDELGIPQGCTRCAHLLDDGWGVPRCVDACATGALRFGDESDFADEIAHAERLSEGSHVYYLNLPKRFIAGEMCDEEADEVLIGATVTAVDEAGESHEAHTDDFGDFWMEGLPKGKYEVRFACEGYLPRVLEANTADCDVNMGSIALYKG